MPKRKHILSKGEIYHVFNRSVARMPIFSVKKDFIRFLDLVDYYRFSNTQISYSHFKNLSVALKSDIMDGMRKENKFEIEILAFCLMNNHFHFLVKQLNEKGIATWMSNVQNGYAKYYNIKTKRTGPLFQPMFQAIRIETDEQLLYVSRYIHLNPSTGYLVTIDKLLNYPWSSLSYYIEGERKFQFINTEMLLLLANGNVKYREFVFDQAAYQRELATIKHLLLE